MISEYYLLRGFFQPKQFSDLVTDIWGWEESKINVAKKYEKIQQVYYYTNPTLNCMFLFHGKSQHKNLMSSYFGALFTSVANSSLISVDHRQYHHANFSPALIFLAANSPIFVIGTCVWIRQQFGDRLGAAAFGQNTITTKVQLISYCWAWFKGKSLKEV